MLNKKSSKNSSNINIHQNINNVKIKAKHLEEKAKMKEMQMSLNGGAGNNPELGEYVSNMYLEAIKAKLSILNSLQLDEKKE